MCVCAQICTQLIAGIGIVLVHMLKGVHACLGVCGPFGASVSVCAWYGAVYEVITASGTVVNDETSSTRVEAILGVNNVHRACILGERTFGIVPSWQPVIAEAARGLAAIATAIMGETGRFGRQRLRGWPGAGRGSDIREIQPGELLQDTVHG